LFPARTANRAQLYWPFRPNIYSMWVRSSVGRARESHSRGQGFESPRIHLRNIWYPSSPVPGIAVRRGLRRRVLRGLRRDHGSGDYSDRLLPVLDAMNTAHAGGFGSSPPWPTSEGSNRLSPGRLGSSPWLYIQSEALQDIAFHLRPGPSPASSAGKITVLSRCGEAESPSGRVQNRGPGAITCDSFTLTPRDRPIKLYGTV
jgi:hypothetical protein